MLSDWWEEEPQREREPRQQRGERERLGLLSQLSQRFYKNNQRSFAPSHRRPYL